MKKIDLCGIWNLNGGGYSCAGTIPGSVYSFLLHNNLVDDPYFRDNEQFFLKLMNYEYEFSKEFDMDVPKENERVLLHCDGLDTLCELYLNNEKIAYTNNMHRQYEFDVTDILKQGKNKIVAKFLPIDPYIKSKHAERELSSSPDTMKGFSYIRKSYCMMGWDWGPMLPDAGIWRDIYLLVENSARIKDVHITQQHFEDNVFVTTCVELSHEAEVCVEIIAPDGNSTMVKANEEINIENPKLWYPNGLGEQPLYTINVTVIEDGKIVDSCTKRIGLRTIELIKERDVYGESFYHKINGIPFFAMGGNYIPEDNILSRITYERSKKLLTQCRDCNFNAIRVWGGGYYPDNWFFDICDELGIVVFMDMMFACAMVPDDEEYIDNISVEVEENLRRIRHHACIAVISGNNEVEEGLEWVPDKELHIDNYIRIFEGIIPDIVKKICPEIPYVPSSPSTCGHGIVPGNENYGDTHYWQGWHGGLPFTEYRKHYFRYLSEFGHQSFPCEKTVNQFTLPEERNIFSRIFEMHQRSSNASKKILMCLTDTFKYPTDFGTLLYASQLVQSEAIRYCVEHLRRNRGRCMGTLYWQINDIWPVASWSSIDSYGRFKALQYVAKRFYAPVLISCEEIGEKETRPLVTLERSYYDYDTKATLCLTNDTPDKVSGKVRWALRSANSEIIKSDKVEAIIEPFSVNRLDTIDFNKTDFENNYMSYEYEVDGVVLSEGTALFTSPKHFNFQNPSLRYKLNGNEITVFAETYARAVEIYSPDSDFILSDNYFDMNGGSKTVVIVEGTPKTIVLRSAYDVK